MDGQLLLTCLAIGLAAGMVMLRVVRTARGLRGGNNCGGGCGCAKASPASPQQPPLIASEQITMRQR